MEHATRYPGIKHPAEIAAFVEQALGFVEQIARFTEGSKADQGPYPHFSIHPLQLLIPDLAKLTVTTIEYCDGDEAEVLEALRAMFREVFQNTTACEGAFAFMRDEIQKLRREQAENLPYRREIFETRLRVELIHYNVALSYEEKARTLAPEQLKSYQAYTAEDVQRIKFEILELLIQIGEIEGFDVAESCTTTILNDLGDKPSGVIDSIKKANPSLELLAARLCHDARYIAGRRKLGI